MELVAVLAKTRIIVLVSQGKTNASRDELILEVKIKIGSAEMESQIYQMLTIEIDSASLRISLRLSIDNYELF